MRSILAKWVNEADALHHIQRLGFQQIPLQLNYLKIRESDYHLSLIGELFQRIREPYKNPADWSRLGNALTQLRFKEDNNQQDFTKTVLSSEMALFAATAFYFGGFSASAYLTLKSVNPTNISKTLLSCYELLTKTSNINTENVKELIYSVRSGKLQLIKDQITHTIKHVKEALEIGPDEWIGSRLFLKMLEHFEKTNIRVILPNGEDEFWNPLVNSLLNRTPPIWDFFPSQIDAIKNGLLENPSTFSLQMPTGAGKTALSETLLFYFLRKNPSKAAVLLVPYRSLASELRKSLVKRLNNMGISARCAYGGTVPTGDEVRNLDDTRVIVATPEALSGLLGANATFFSRIDLVICDEGHLLDGKTRGVGLELLLSRMLSRENGAPRFVFISAIVPNIEEINAWLGGTEKTVVHSNYRPAMADFAILRTTGNGKSMSVSLHLHPHENQDSQFQIDEFLTHNDFLYRNQITGRLNKYHYNSIKTQTVAAARKTLNMGFVAIFATNKNGNQGAIGLAEELLLQLQNPIPLPTPNQFVKDAVKLHAAVEYFILEYGINWIGTRALTAGAVLHHGDIPQESREVLEGLVREEIVHLAICTNTLAEGVNLPIRTLILYSVQRRSANGAIENLLSRDIKNLVGRAGRAGATTKGLVICANPNQWFLIEPVAKQQPGERVAGALYKLIGNLQIALKNHPQLSLTNEVLEKTTALHSLIDGIDATLIDLAVDELGENEFIRIAGDLSTKTYAACQAEDDALGLMRKVFELRAQRISNIRTTGHLGWIRETGVRARMLDSIESSLFPLSDKWDCFTNPIDPDLIDVILAWGWEQPDIKMAISDAYQDNMPTRETFRDTVLKWLEGKTLIEMATAAGLDINIMLSIHSKVLNHALQVSVEQAIGILKKLLEEKGKDLSSSVLAFPEHLRFGVPTQASRILSEGGVRHRRASVALGLSQELKTIEPDNKNQVFVIAKQLLEDRERWLPELGNLVLEHTIEDLTEVIK